MTHEGTDELRLPIRAEADAVWLRKQAADYAASLGFSSHMQWEISIAVSELATNAVRHAGAGALTLRAIEGGLEVVVEDNGNGINDVGLAFEDGVSDGVRLQAADRPAGARSLGSGLGAVRRLMDEVEISGSDTLGGARVVTRKWLRPADG